MVVRVWDVEEKEKGDSQSQPSKHIRFVHWFVRSFTHSFIILIECLKSVYQGYNSKIKQTRNSCMTELIFSWVRKAINKTNK